MTNNENTPPYSVDPFHHNIHTPSLHYKRNTNALGDSFSSFYGKRSSKSVAAHEGLRNQRAAAKRATSSEELPTTFGSFYNRKRRGGESLNTFSSFYFPEKKFFSPRNLISKPQGRADEDFMPFI